MSGRKLLVQVVHTVLTGFILFLVALAVAVYSARPSRDWTLLVTLSAAGLFILVDFVGDVVKLVRDATAKGRGNEGDT